MHAAEDEEIPEADNYNTDYYQGTFYSERNDEDDSSPESEEVHQVGFVSVGRFTKNCRQCQASFTSGNALHKYLSSKKCTRSRQVPVTEGLPVLTPKAQPLPHTAPFTLTNSD